MFRGPAHRPSPPPGLHAPFGSGLQAKVGAGPAQKPTPRTNWRAAHSSGSPPSSSADLQKFFLLRLHLRRGLLPGCLWASALRHDVRNLRQWTPRRDFIRFWRYVDCNIQWLHGAPLLSPVKPQWDRVRRGFDLWRPDNPIFVLCIFIRIAYLPILGWRFAVCRKAF